MRLWNVARTSTQLKNNVNNVDPKSEGLLGYWKMNEGHGYTFEDATGNGNTAECEYSRAGDMTRSLTALRPDWNGRPIWTICNSCSVRSFLLI